jgi:hypothetical protein
MRRTVRFASPSLLLSRLVDRLSREAFGREELSG